MKNPKAAEVDTVGNVIFVGTEQPETCRWRGAHTDFEELTDSIQRHKCMSCRLEYFVEIDAT